MNKIYKKEWIRALKSGKYKQGRQRLKIIHKDKSNSYCCLGILCNIIAKKGLGKWEKRNFIYNDDIFETELEGDLMDEVELHGIEQDHLIKMNDQDKSSFKKIADYIDKNL